MLKRKHNLDNAIKSMENIWLKHINSLTFKFVYNINNIIFCFLCYDLHSFTFRINVIGFGRNTETISYL